MDRSRPDARLGDLLDRERRRRFVGRRRELAFFDDALSAEEPSFAVLHIHGPGGIGKSTLLRAFAGLASDAGRTVIEIDARVVRAAPDPIADALSVATRPAGAVVLVDGYEAWAALDDWLRETLLPRLPARSLVVLAGRDPPAVAWRTDLAWAGLTQIQELRPLLPAESAAFLTLRDVPEAQHEQALAFARGHPLALALVADAVQRGDQLSTFDPRRQPDIVHALLERFVREVPSSAHQQALAVCALAWATTETLLTEVIGPEVAVAVFAWLRGLAFIEEGPYGLIPHDLAREMLMADLRWRHPGELQRLVQLLATRYYTQFLAAEGEERQRIWFDLFSLNRYEPAFGPYFEWNALGSAYASPAAASDHATILAMVERHEGDEARRIAHYWLQRQPESFLTFRDATSEPFGFMAHLALRQEMPDDINVDPAMATAMAFIAQHNPLAPGEEIAYLRFWMDRDRYQEMSPAQDLTAINIAIAWASRTRLAWNLVAIADPDGLEAHFSSIQIPRAAEADFVVGGRRYGVFARDWRLEPVAAWIGAEPAVLPCADHSTSPAAHIDLPDLAMSQPDFFAAVRQALRYYTRTDRLERSPLIWGCPLIGSESEASPASALQVLLRAALEPLAANPKDAKHHRALWHTYFEPAPTQEAAAELLGIPFSTYRYQLAKGTEHVSQWLWERQSTRRNSPARLDPTPQVG